MAEETGDLPSADQPIGADDDRRDEAERFLRALAGPGAALRDDQWTAIRALVNDRRRALVVQRTGWGKSAVYLTATALLRARGAGPSIIVSPLLALMRNQIEAAARAGIQARTVNSANTDEWEQVYAEVSAGLVDVLLVSPERLNNPGFRDLVLPKLIAAAGMLVVAPVGDAVRLRLGPRLPPRLPHVRRLSAVAETSPHHRPHRDSDTDGSKRHSRPTSALPARTLHPRLPSRQPPHRSRRDV